MVDPLELLLVALASLVGSGFMWTVLGPRVIAWAAPRTLQKIALKTFGITPEDLAAADGNAMKAIATKQGATMAAALTGSLGKIVQEIPTDQLDELAKKYGYADSKDAVQKLGPVIGGGGFDPAAMAGVFGDLGGKGGGGFTKIAQIMSAFNSLGAIGGGPSDSSESGGGAPNKFMEEYLRR